MATRAFVRMTIRPLASVELNPFGTSSDSGTSVLVLGCQGQGPGARRVYAGGRRARAGHGGCRARPRLPCPRSTCPTCGPGRPQPRSTRPHADITRRRVAIPSGSRTQSGTMRTIVVGGTGLLSTAAELTRRGHEVTLASRHRLDEPALAARFPHRHVHLDVATASPDDVRRAVAGHDSLVYAVVPTSAPLPGARRPIPVRADDRAHGPARSPRGRGALHRRAGLLLHHLAPRPPAARGHGTTPVHGGAPAPVARRAGARRRRVRGDGPGDPVRVRRAARTAGLARS